MSGGSEPVTHTSHGTKQYDDLLNHLIGFHKVPMKDVRRKAYKDLVAIHDKVKEVRWCRVRITRGKGKNTDYRSSLKD